MPRRRRVGKRLAGPLTLDEKTMWENCTRESLVEAFGSLAAAIGEWRLRKVLFAEPVESFWQLEGPPHLRTEPPKARGVGASSHAEVIDAVEAFEERRRRWLAAQELEWHEIGEPPEAP